MTSKDDFQALIEKIRETGELPKEFTRPLYCFRIQSEGTPMYKEWVSRGWPYADYDKIDDFIDDGDAIATATSGASCFEDPDSLIDYWEARGGTSFGQEALLVYGPSAGLGPDDEDLVIPEAELGRMDIEEFYEFVKQLSIEISEEQIPIEFIKKAGPPLPFGEPSTEECMIARLVEDYRDGEIWVEPEKDWFPIEELQEDTSLRKKLKDHYRRECT